MAIFKDQFDGVVLHICGDMPEKRNYDYRYNAGDDRPQEKNILRWFSKSNTWRRLNWWSTNACPVCSEWSKETYEFCPICGEELPRTLDEESLRRVTY